MNVNIPKNAKLVSFDVVNLFPSVPINKCKGIIKNVVWKSKIDSLRKSDLTSSISMCMDQNYFLFNNEIYYQSKFVYG